MNKLNLDRREFGWSAAAALCVGAAWGEPGVPGRIVSTAPSSTETLFALGLGKNVVGVSVYCEYPPEVRALAKVGNYVKPDLEAIVRLRPDLVVLQKHEGSIAGRLQALRIRSVEMPYGLLADVYAGITAVAGGCGVAGRGVALNARIQERLAEIKTRSARTPKVRAMVIADRRAGTLSDLYAVGPTNYLNEMMQIAGGMNVLGDGSPLAAGMPMYPHISLETVLRADPEVIVDMTDAHDADEAHGQVRARDRALWGAHPELAAVKAGRVFLGTSVALLVPGPRTPEAAELFYGYFHDGKA